MRLRRPSSPLVISILALVIATSGTALAASHYLITSSKQIKPGAIALRNLSRGARSALHGANGRAGPPGLPGQPGIPGTARAFGYVQLGAFNSSLPNRDIASVTNPALGKFCITLADGTTPRTSGILAIPDNDHDATGTGANQNQAFVETASAGCSPTAFSVLTFERSEVVSGGNVTQVDLDQLNQGFFFMVP
ncbi:MAG: hypothetical protein ACR2L9_02140 [Solirubrobacteraceae bacterium]